MLYPALNDRQTQPEINCFNTQNMRDCNTKIKQYSNHLFNYTHQHMHIHTHTHIYIYILFKKSKIYIKTFKMLLHVSIT